LQGLNMSESHNDDVWLSALEGKHFQGDPSIRQAEQLRDYYTQRSALELEDVLDDASYTRTMNYLRAQGAFAPRPSASPAAPAKASLWQAVQLWLFPAEGGAGGRYALIAGLVIAVMAVPVVVTQMGADDEPWRVDDASFGQTPGPATKSPPPVGTPGTAKGMPPLPSGVQMVVVLSNDPTQLAQEIQSVLFARGIPAQVDVSKTGPTLAADIAAAQLTSVQQDLLAYGIQVPADGHLRLSLRKQ
jgi:hypothetical protein